MKKRKMSLGAAITTSVIGGVLSIGLIVGTVIAYQYEDLIDVYFTKSDFETSVDSMELCEDVVEEGLVLLKNEDDVLPLSTDKKIALLGQDSVDFVYCGTGSGSVDTSTAPTLKTALESKGFTIDETLWDFYESGPGSSYRKETPDSSGAGDFAVNEVPRSVYTDEVIASLDSDDVAIVSLGRSGGESADIPTTPLASGYRYLEIDQDERDLLDLACSKFDDVILIINANNPLELGFLEDEEYQNIRAAIWIGGVGQEGLYGLADVIAGEASPSGRLVDTYAYDSLSAPSSVNLGDYSITNSSVTRGNTYLIYGEGIYVGYRYYETRYEDVVLGNTTGYDYSSTVQYPFGYGLSYTDFSWSDFEVSTGDDDDFIVTLSVSNEGEVAGKDVVEIYAQKPYTEGGPEVASIELVGLAKTSLLEPGESEIVTIDVDRRDLTTYDSEDAETYILTAGDYYLSAGKNAHDALNNILASKGYDVSDGMDYDGDSSLADLIFSQDQIDAETYSTSEETGAEITNLFDDVDINNYASYTYLSRSDWDGTYPTLFEGGQWEAPQALLDDLEFYDVESDTSDDEEIDDFTFVQNSEETSYTVNDLIGADYDDERWDDLVNQLSYSQMTRLIRMGGYSTIQIDRIELPSTQDKDGPSGISATLVGGSSTMAWPAEVVMASTWNTDLINDLGKLFGHDSIQAGVAGVYGPGANIHRSPYSGRNFEYFSEDPFLSYTMTKNEIEGLRSRGVITYTKHFFLNDQETNRSGGAIFANEQSIREIYTRGFQGAVDGGSNALMAAMNRIGARWVGAHRGAMTSLLRDEWGFEGMVITDQASVPAMFYQDMISGLWAGTDIWLNTNSSYWSLSDYSEDQTMLYYIHRAAKNIIYAITDSWAVDTSYTVDDSGEIIQSETWMIPWRGILTAIDCVIIILSVFGITYCWTIFLLNKRQDERQDVSVTEENKE